MLLVTYVSYITPPLLKIFFTNINVHIYLQPINLLAFINIAIILIYKIVKLLFTKSINTMASEWPQDINYNTNKTNFFQGHSIDHLFPELKLIMTE